MCESHGSRPRKLGAGTAIRAGSSYLTHPTYLTYLT